MPKVRFEREDITLEVPAGQTVLQVAEKAGISVFRGMWPELHCERGSGWCNRCKVWVKAASDLKDMGPKFVQSFGDQAMCITGQLAASVNAATNVQANVSVSVSVSASASGSVGG